MLFCFFGAIGWTPALATIINPIAEVPNHPWIAAQFFAFTLVCGYSVARCKGRSIWCAFNGPCVYLLRDLNVNVLSGIPPTAWLADEKNEKPKEPKPAPIYHKQTETLTMPKSVEIPAGGNYPTRKE